MPRMSEFEDLLDHLDDFGQLPDYDHLKEILVHSLPGQQFNSTTKLDWQI